MGFNAGDSMFEVGTFLDRAKQRARLPSDYALAKRLGVLPSRISNWRRGENVPDERAITKLCELAGEDPDFTIAAIQALRASNDDARRAWTQIANRLRHPTTAKIAVALAIIFVAQFFGGQDAAALVLPVSINSMSYTSYLLVCLAVSLLRRLSSWLFAAGWRGAARAYRLSRV
jgi:transcriptional regulator with XRE-family HTH domain